MAFEQLFFLTSCTESYKSYKKKKHMLFTDVILSALLFFFSKVSTLSNFVYFSSKDNLGSSCLE